MPEPDLSRRLLNMGAGSREEGGLGARKKNAEDYDKAVSGPSDLPKATPTQDNPDKINKRAKFGDRKGEVRIPVDQMTKPLGSFKSGTDYVPKTGNYQLHEGEKVVPKKENMAADIFAHVPGRTEPKPAKKEIKRIEITKSHNGKHTVKHIHHHPAHEDETHNMNDMAALHSHLEDHAGTPNEGEGAESTGTPAPAPMTPSMGAPAPQAGV
jgi:hypothetical protein